MNPIQSTNTQRPTPWGKADYQYIIARGIAWVNTPSHGGFMIGVGVAQTYLSDAARERGTISGAAYLAFEEDCDASIVLFEHPELIPMLGYKAEVLDTLLESLSLWHPDYLIERGIAPAPKQYAEWMRRKEEDKLRAEKSPNLIISWRKRDGINSEQTRFMYAVTADGKEHPTTRKEYDRVYREALQNNKLFLLSDFKRGAQTMTIGERLDRLYPAQCLACRTPYRRVEAKWQNGASRNICKSCGLDQGSAEAGAIARARSLRLVDRLLGREVQS